MSRIEQLIATLFIISFSTWVFFLTTAESGHNEPASSKFSVTGITPLGEDWRTEEILLDGEGFSPDVRATLTLDTANRGAIVSTLSESGSLRAIAVQGETAFLANGYRGVQSVDLTDPEHPRIIGSLSTKREAVDLAIRDGFAYVLKRGKGNGLLVVDIRDPKNLTKAAEIPLSGRCLDIAIKGDYAFIANFATGLQVVSIEDPHHPQMVSLKLREEFPSRAMAIAITGETAYLAQARGDLLVIDISESKEPRLLTSLSGVSGQNLHLKGNRLYLGSHKKTMTILDISSPRNPKVISSTQLRHTVRQIAVDGDRAYLAGGGVIIFDISDERNPHQISRVEVNGSPWEMAFWQDFVLVASDRGGLEILRKDWIENRRSIEILPEGIGKLAFEGNNLYLAGDGFQVYRIDTPGKLNAVGDLPFPNTAKDLKVKEGRALVRFDGKVWIIDVRNPTAPRVISTLYEPALKDASAFDDLLFAACGTEGVRIYRFQVDAPPLLISEMNLGKPVLSVAAQSRRLYALTKNSLLVIDVTNPETPQIEKSIPVPWHYSAFSGNSEMVLDKKHLYICDGRNGLIVISLDRHQIASDLVTPGIAVDLVVRGHYAVVLANQSGSHIIDIRDPRHLQILTTVKASTSPKGLTIDDNQLYLSTREDGLFSIPMPAELEKEWLHPRQIRLELPPEIPPGRYSLQLTQGENQSISLERIELRN